MSRAPVTLKLQNFLSAIFSSAVCIPQTAPCSNFSRLPSQGAYLMLYSLGQLGTPCFSELSEWHVLCCDNNTHVCKFSNMSGEGLPPRGLPETCTLHRFPLPNSHHAQHRWYSTGRHKGELHPRRFLRELSLGSECWYCHREGPWNAPSWKGHIVSASQTLLGNTLTIHFEPSFLNEQVWFSSHGMLLQVQQVVLTEDIPAWPRLGSPNSASLRENSARPYQTAMETNALLSPHTSHRGTAAFRKRQSPLRF